MKLNMHEMTLAMIASTVILAATQVHATSAPSTEAAAPTVSAMLTR